MTISSSLNAGVAGLTANATRLASISDNIANSGTAGYRRVETDFHSMVLAGGGAYAAGGVSTESTRQIGQRGSTVATNNSTDLAVSGRGFLPVTPTAELDQTQGTSSLMLATTGSFRTNADGFLVTTSNQALMGWPALADGRVPDFPRDSAAGLEPIQVNANQLTGAPTTSISFTANLPATSTLAGAEGTAETLSIAYYDNLGLTETLGIRFTPTVPAAGASNEWTMVLTDSAQDDAVVGEYTLTFDDTRAGTGTLGAVATVNGGAFDPATGTMIVATASGPMEINIGTIGDPDGMSQLSDSFAPMSTVKDGTPVGNLTGLEVNENGMLQAVYDTGATRTIYQIPLIDMPNPDGLVSLDGQAYATSPESGTFFLWDAGSGPTGGITAYALEESTTDVAAELTDMIQTQRAYTSNARVIQTVDEMLQEATNIIR